MEFRQILFATDFSAASEPAARVAAAMASRAGAALLVVHVVPPLTDPSFAAERLTVASAAFGVPIETAMLSGRPGVKIVGLARSKGVDLIVIGTHGRTGVSRAILGSVAEYVVRTAPCMVLTVPATLTGTAKPAEPEQERAAPSHCIVCAAESLDLVCEPCRTRIRGEALEHKLDAERAGRRGSPA